MNYMYLPEDDSRIEAEYRELVSAAYFLQEKLDAATDVRLANIRQPNVVWAKVCLNQAAQRTEELVRRREKHLAETLDRLLDRRPNTLPEDAWA